MSDRTSPRSNHEIADALFRIADLLEAREANPFRVGSYRAAAREVAALDRAAAAIYDEGGPGALQAIPGVGQGIAAIISELVEEGRARLLEHLEAERAPEAAFQRLPGVGPKLAARIHDELRVDTLEDLEQAAHDGRLEGVPGIGARKARGIRDALAGILGRRGRPSHPGPNAAAHPAPSVSLLLNVDETYRGAAEMDALPRIAPRRFNPGGERWLPIYHVERDGWDITALYSNTRRAHDLERTRDWVVVYYHRDGDHGQATVVTSHARGLEGRRVVRGREPECRRYYRALER